jgi:hypothetical protein
MMNLRDQLLHLATTYATATNAKSRAGGVSLSSVSTKIFNDGKTLARLTDGGDVTTGNFERALIWFSDNWPAGCKWPKKIARPAPTEGRAA